MSTKSIIIVGGGVNGLSAAYFLQKDGFDVTVIDRGTIDDNCSFGNMGFISPSHYIPLASPGIVAEGLKHLLNSRSPFYIKPRLDFGLIKWAWTFLRNSNQKNIDKNAGPLVELMNFSRRLMYEINEDLGQPMSLESKGLLMMCLRESAFKDEIKVAEGAKKYGLETIILNKEEMQAREPDVELGVSGAVLYPGDCHIHPGEFMLAMKKHLQKAGVKFQLNTTVIGFEQNEHTVKKVLTDKGDFEASHYLLSPGSWLGKLTEKLDHKLMVEGGKGYSATYEHVEKNIRYPAILVDGRCAITPWGHRLRIGGTMEFSGLNDKILVKRMEGIYRAVKEFYPGLDIPFPAEEEIWSGLRPVSPDGVPYIGKLGDFSNVTVSGGNAMLGMTEGAGAGKLLTQLISGKDPAIDLTPFNTNRFK